MTALAATNEMRAAADKQAAKEQADAMPTPDPLIVDLHAAIAKVACRVVERPDWLRDVSPTDRALVERVLELAVLVLGGRKDVIH